VVRDASPAITLLAVKTYHDRVQAGQVLARHLAHHRGEPDGLVLALPRGGVPVALEVARHLNLPLDVFLVRKLGLPGHEELAMGAIASGGIRLLNVSVIEEAGVSANAIEAVTATESEELKRREELYRGARPAQAIPGRSIIVVDDGLATGFTMRAALKGLRALKPLSLTVAVPVGAADTCDELAEEADELVCPLQPSPFQAVGLWYDHFAATSDDEVCKRLAEGAELPLR
jgi:putative phosphoribosyl transferase